MALLRSALERFGLAPLPVQALDLGVQLRQSFPGPGLPGFGVPPCGEPDLSVSVQIPEANRGQASRQVGGFQGQRLMPAGQFRLLTKGFELPTELCQDVLEPEKVLLQSGQLPFRSFPASTVLGDPRRLLHELAPLLGPGGEDVLQVALADDGVQGSPHARVGQQLLDVEEPAGPAAEPIFTITGPVDRPADLDLGGRDRNEPSLVVDDHADVGHPQGRPAWTSGEDDVGHLSASHCARSLFPKHPGDGIGDVRLAGSIGAHDHADARRELERGPIGERLEPSEGE
jgi:hypothetical protein